ncbi:MAG: 4-(cytidine 5'-diphospho)-2-C-methyl-D-erythritol kinase [Chloroflexota bacterium]
MTMLRLSACAKINLGLEILGRRSDGFHEIVSVTQTISLADSIQACPATSLTVEMDPPLVDAAENLVRRAAEALALATGQHPSGRIHVTKRIPLAAGLGGGSSDAATTLLLLNRLWGTHLGAVGLAPIAATLGSDVSLFLRGGTCLIRGRGEQVEQLPPVRPIWLVLVCPDISPPDKTRALYRALQPEEWGDGATTLALADRAREGQPLDAEMLVNSFDGAAARVYPDFARLRSSLQALTGQAFHLTGAGPSLFALFDEQNGAKTAVRALKAAGIASHLARSVATNRRIRASGAAIARSVR